MDEQTRTVDQDARKDQMFEVQSDVNILKIQQVSRLKQWNDKTE